MNKHWVQQVLEDHGHFDNVRSYSGRGMYGKSCLGVTMRRGELSEFDLGVLLAGHQEEYSGNFSPIPKPSTDNMGLDMIAYWPSIPYIDDDEEEGE